MDDYLGYPHDSGNLQQLVIYGAFRFVMTGYPQENPPAIERWDFPPKTHHIFSMGPSRPWTPPYNIWLVVFRHPSEKYDFVNWDDDSNPILMGK